MGTDDFYQLFGRLVETQRLDPQTAQWLLQKILDLLFSDPENQRIQDK